MPTTVPVRHVLYAFIAGAAAWWAGYQLCLFLWELLS